eukprot:TRINITY_DN32385_c0_g1_i1.p1 TRINITY_DN32385_c0_g1~~TRINITY_DN32385_c0_g1_i1.p1  ORF type:complete len:363 (+),score=74.82 TRINITY_DN32385_c0_g1_i1:26-1090(+)
MLAGTPRPPPPPWRRVACDASSSSSRGVLRPKWTGAAVLLGFSVGGDHALDLGAAEAQLEPCARLLLESGGRGRQEELMSCRVPLLGSLHEDRIPGYRYNATEDCHFWASYAARDRHVEGSRVLDFNRIASYRLHEPFVPPLRQNGTALYVGAHRLGEDGLEFRRRYQLQMHLFEPSPTFFRSLSEALAGEPGFTLHNYGLGARTRQMKLRLSGTASRTVDGAEEVLGDHADSLAETDGTEPVLIRAAAEAVPEVLAAASSAPSSRSVGIELLHVNCEGCEYDVVEGLRKAGQLEGVAQVQVATHLLEHNAPAANWEEVSVKRYCEMHRILSQTHDRAWGLPWVWERWTRRKNT